MAYTSSAYLRICFFLATFCSMGISTERNPKTLKTCGISTIQQDRIVGGGPADHGEYPWMAGLEIFGGNIICGAAILNERWIVTAAHCLEESEEPRNYAIYVGSHVTKGKNEKYRPQRYEVFEIIMHEDYDGEYNDIALVHTKYPIDIKGSNGLVNGICLPRKGEEPTGSAIVTGWGDTKYEGIETDILHEVEVSIVPKRPCMKQYGIDFKNAEGLMCAGSHEKDSCQGDSGGPLIQENASGQYTLIGIVSFGGDECASETHPGVYTKVSSYIDWLYENME